MRQLTGAAITILIAFVVLNSCMRRSMCFPSLSWLSNRGPLFASPTFSARYIRSTYVPNYVPRTDDQTRNRSEILRASQQSIPHGPWPMGHTSSLRSSKDVVKGLINQGGQQRRRESSRNRDRLSYLLCPQPPWMGIGVDGGYGAGLPRYCLDTLAVINHSLQSHRGES